MTGTKPDGCFHFSYPHFLGVGFNTQPLDELRRQTISASHEWCDDVIAGLRINGVSLDRIKICNTSGGGVRVFVDDVARYQFDIGFKT